MSNKRVRALAPGPEITSEEAKAYEERSLAELRRAGYRITMPRVQVIRALADTTRALSAYAIHEKIVSAGGKIDVVSVYRILTTLEDAGLITHVGIVDGFYPCRKDNSSARRSQVMVDDETETVRELELPKEVADSIERQAEALGIQIGTLKIEIRGNIRRN